MEELVKNILKEFEKRNLSINDAHFILEKVLYELSNNSVVKLKKDK